MARELVTRGPTERVLECGRLRLRFSWQQDRFGHEVSLVDGTPVDKSLIDGERGGLVLHSVEGAASEAWPASPPLQSLHVEEQGGRQVALLVGMAGKCHWSAAVELEAEHSRLRWDVACRVRGGDFGWLGSSYRSETPWASLELGATSIAGAAGRIVIRVEGEAASLEVKERQLQVKAGTNVEHTGAATIRWSYTIEAGA